MPLRLTSLPEVVEVMTLTVDLRHKELVSDMTSPIRRIIIVDDHDAVRRGFGSCWRPSHIIRSWAKLRTGARRLELARETRPDIAILDYSIPELNGFDLSHALKREFPRIEILVYTMHDREEIIMDVLRAGVRGFVLKSDTEKHL